MFKKRYNFLTLILVSFLTALGLAAVLIFLLRPYVGNMADFYKAMRTVRLIKRVYVEDVTREQLFTGAMKGMLKSLGDPHSAYLDAKTFKELSEYSEGHFYGIGIVMGMKDKKFIVVAPMEDTPAYKAGLKTADVILAVDGEDTANMDMENVVKRIRGPVGTKVELKVQTGKEEPRLVSIIRSDIKIKSVHGKMRENKIGYIRVSAFSETTAGDFARELDKLEGEGMQGLILDLRGNPGGLFTAGVDVSKRLVPKGPIVSVTEKNGSTVTEYSELKENKYPIAVLVDMGSASASEIVAGALQDTGAGYLIGTKTYGKGSVQSVYRLDRKTGVKLTMAKYFTPKGRSINGVGLEPDKVVEAEGERGNNQIEAAEQYLLEKISK